MKRLIKFLYHFAMVSCGLAFVGILSIIWLDGLVKYDNADPFDGISNPPGLVGSILFGTIIISIVIVTTKRILKSIITRV